VAWEAHCCICTHIAEQQNAAGDVQMADAAAADQEEAAPVSRLPVVATDISQEPGKEAKCCGNRLIFAAFH
jgi:hypothetical protein